MIVQYEPPAVRQLFSSVNSSPIHKQASSSVATDLSSLSSQSQSQSLLGPHHHPTQSLSLSQPPLGGIALESDGSMTNLLSFGPCLSDSGSNQVVYVMQGPPQDEDLDTGSLSCADNSIATSYETDSSRASALSEPPVPLVFSSNFNTGRATTSTPPATARTGTQIEIERRGLPGQVCTPLQPKSAMVEALTPTAVPDEQTLTEAKDCVEQLTVSFTFETFIYLVVLKYP